MINDYVRVVQYNNPLVLDVLIKLIKSSKSIPYVEDVIPDCDNAE